MKKSILVIILAVLLIGGSLAVYFYNNNNVSHKRYNIDMEPTPLTEDEMVETLEGYGAIGALADTDLTVMDMLTYAVQDEYLAHAEYEAIITEFGSIKPYVNIVLAEETHLSYLKEIYESYELDFPEDDSAEHVVVPTTLLEAAETGVQAEINNIDMYEEFLTYDLPDSVRNVFIILRDGSENHLKAFQKQVDKLS